MSRTTVTLMQGIYEEIKSELFVDASESAALVLCGKSAHQDPWTGELEERYLVREVIRVEAASIYARSPTSIRLSTTPFYHLLKRAARLGLVAGMIHSHPNGPCEFSGEDDTSDQELMEIAAARVEATASLLSMVIDNRGEIVARAYRTDDVGGNGKYRASVCQMVRVIGSRWRFSVPARGIAHVGNELDRQVLTFGRKATEDLGVLRVGIVGCGGTGSAVASLLARVGVRKIALFDEDTVDETNLNRMHFSRRSDANRRRKKVDVIGDALADIGLSTSIVVRPFPIDSSSARDAALCCDILFGCTDDHLGRNFLNRVAHFYLLPVIDLGLLIEPNDDGTYDAFDGRVTVVQPGYPCQVCRGLIDPSTMADESTRRNDPLLHAIKVRAGYVIGGDDPSPVVVTFTSELAAMAVNELFQRLTGFRGPNGSCPERVRRFDEIKDSDVVPAGKSRPKCPLCERRRYDALGDVSPFLDQVT